MKVGAPRPAIVAYDVASNKRRRRIHKVLQEWRLDGQKSLIECRLTHHQADELMLRLGELIDAAEDRLLLAWMDTRRPARARGLGVISATQQIKQVH